MKQKLRRPKTEQELELDKIKKGIFTLQIVMACFLAMILIALNFIVLWYRSSNNYIFKSSCFKKYCKEVVKNGQTIKKEKG